MNWIDWATFSCIAPMALATCDGTVRSHSSGEPTLRRISTHRWTESSWSFMPVRSAVSKEPIACWNTSDELLVAVIIYASLRKMKTCIYVSELHIHSAVYRNDLPSDVACLRRCQEQYSSGHFFRLAEPSHGRHRRDCAQRRF